MIDTHCHIDDAQYMDGFDAFILAQQQDGVEAILVPGVDESSCTSVPDVCRRYPGYLYPALGLHPEEVRADYREVLARIRTAVDAQRLIAIGEIGLDYHFSTEYKAEQQDAFRIQLDWARELALPVMLHARDAAEDTLRIIRECGQEDGRAPLVGVAHCFSGSYEIAQAYVRAGFYIGVGGVITFKNCKLAETLCPRTYCPDSMRENIPLDRILLETDAPYMAPVPNRGKRNESRWMSYVVERLAEAYQTDRNTIIEATNRNAKRLFDLK